MAPNESAPDSPEANMTIFIKGATERILRRVTKIRMRDSSGRLYDAPFDEAARQDVQRAEQDFGARGERTLAFARIELDPREFPKAT